MNALQVAIGEFHEDMAIYLLKETNISAMHKDAHGRDALRLAIQIGSDDLCEAVEDRWNDEYKVRMQASKKVSAIRPPQNN